MIDYDYCPKADNGCETAKNLTKQFWETCVDNYKACPIYAAHKFTTLEDGRPRVMAPQSAVEFLKLKHTPFDSKKPYITFGAEKMKETIGGRTVVEAHEVLFKHELILSN